METKDKNPQEDIEPLQNTPAAIRDEAPAGKDIGYYTARVWVNMTVLVGTWIIVELLKTRPVYGDQVGLVFWIIAFFAFAEVGMRFGMQKDGSANIAATAGATLGILSGFVVAVAVVLTTDNGWQMLRLFRDSIGGGVIGFVISGAFGYAGMLLRTMRHRDGKAKEINRDHEEGGDEHA